MLFFSSQLNPLPGLDGASDDLFMSHDLPQRLPAGAGTVNPIGHPNAEALMLDHLALAEAVARRYFRRNPARDEDLLQVAYIGLLKAARRFDAERGTSFAAFAAPTISGEIKRHLRDNGWFVRPPRHVQELRSRITEAVPRLAQGLGRMPGLPELAEDLGASAHEVQEAIQCAEHLYPASLDVVVSEDRDMTLADLIPGDGEELEHAELAAILSVAVRALSPREQRVVHLRFFEDRTQQEIAVELGVTQMQV
ncbi:MAG TPA: RNA polymerase subunit sigma-70, partial [Microbacterium sp.]|nr:RNA polymerase subunit sigma-70 [Microbacterium sp.]